MEKKYAGGGAGEGVSVISMYKVEEGKKHLSMEHRQCNYKEDRPKLLFFFKPQFFHTPSASNTQNTCCWFLLKNSMNFEGTWVDLSFDFFAPLKSKRCDVHISERETKRATNHCESRPGTWPTIWLHRRTINLSVFSHFNEFLIMFVIHSQIL